MLKITATVGKPFKIHESPGTPGRWAVIRHAGKNRVEMVLLDAPPEGCKPAPVADPAVSAHQIGGAL